jgi:L-fuconolactonase
MSEPSSLIVDSHQHFWQVGRFDYPWMTPEVEVLCRDYLPPALAPVLERNGVEQTILVQASNSLEETRWLLKLADQNSFIAGVVGWVDLTADGIEDQLDEFTAHPRFKGVRHLVESEPQDDWLAQPKVLANLRTLAGRGLAYDLLVHTRHLKYASMVADRCPELRLVVDHSAKPPIARGEIDDWSRGLREIASRSNVWCKLSGLVTEADWTGWRIEDLKPCVEFALEVFGPQRMMFGSDWPVCLLAASYDQVADAAQSILAEISEDDRHRIFAANAIDFYRIESGEIWSTAA